MRLMLCALAALLFIGGEAFAQKNGGTTGARNCETSFNSCVERSTRRGWSGSDASRWCSRRKICS